MAAGSAAAAAADAAVADAGPARKDKAKRVRKSKIVYTPDSGEADLPPTAEEEAAAMAEYQTGRSALNSAKAAAAATAAKVSAGQQTAAVDPKFAAAVLAPAVEGSPFTPKRAIHLGVLDVGQSSAAAEVSEWHARPGVDLFGYGLYWSSSDVLPSLCAPWYQKGCCCNVYLLLNSRRLERAHACLPIFSNRSAEEV